jgi:hypothetical protein
MFRYLRDASPQFSRAGRIDEALELTERARRFAGQDPKKLFDVARLAALTVQALDPTRLSSAETAISAAANDSATEADVAKWRSNTADWALTLLRESQAAGWRDFRRLHRREAAGTIPFDAVWKFASYESLPPELAFAFDERARWHWERGAVVDALRDWSRLASHGMFAAQTYDALLREYAPFPWRSGDR